MAARTGQGYINALRDGRCVWHAGERIEDVTTHPGFAGAVATLASIYDLQHSDELSGAMTTQWEGQCISYSYLPPRTPDELAAKRRNVEIWADRTLGYMGRFPDFCSGLTIGLIDIADTLAQDDPRFGENARAYHRYCAQRDLCLTHALNDQFYDRSKRVAEQSDPDLILHVVRETSDGPIVRGVRNLATLAPLCDEALVWPNRPREPDEADYALAFAVPCDAPGLSMICRDLFAEHADPERLPLSSRFDEVDATLVFDDVLIPWERVFVYRNPAFAAQFHGRVSGVWSGFSTLIRLTRKLEIMVGVAELLTQWAGRSKDRAAHTLMGQLTTDVDVLHGCLRAAELDARLTPAGLMAPAMRPAYRLHGIEASDRAERMMEDLLTSSLVLTGGASDLDEPTIGPYVERFFRNNAPSTRDHLRLLALAADMVQTSFAGRNQLYERLQSGEPDSIRQRVYNGFDRASPAERVLRFIREEWTR
jgi:4-hydroxyphenylacetate 3-monooxygenase